MGSYLAVTLWGLIAVAYGYVMRDARKRVAVLAALPVAAATVFLVHCIFPTVDHCGLSSNFDLRKIY